VTSKDVTSERAARLPNGGIAPFRVRTTAAGSGGPETTGNLRPELAEYLPLRMER